MVFGCLSKSDVEVLVELAGTYLGKCIATGMGTLWRRKPLVQKRKGKSIFAPSSVLGGACAAITQQQGEIDSHYLSGLILRNRLRWRAKLLRIFDRFLGLRDFGEICTKAQAFFIRKTHNFQQN